MLKGIGAAMALPFLESMAPTGAKAAAATAAPRRMAYLYFPNGIVREAWDPAKVAADGTLLELNPVMSPLEHLKNDIIIPKNMWTPSGNGHGAGTATWLTGRGYDRGSRRNGGGGVMSVDQIAAEHVGKETLLPSLELSTKGEGYFSNDFIRNTLSWTKNGPATREVEPRIIFDRMFRTGDGGLDKSVLDAVLEDAKNLRRRVGLTDQRKIDEYLEAVRAIERRLEFAEQQSARAEEHPELSKSLVRPPSGIPDDHGEYVRLMMDMMVMAFWADATRVSTFMLDHGQSNRYFDFIPGVNGTYHALSHYDDISGTTEDDDGITSWPTREAKMEQFSRVTTWHNAQVAYFLDRLKGIKEGDSNLLENSMVVYGSSMSTGANHGSKDLPLILAGGGGGTIKSGRQIKYDNDTSLSHLHLSLLQRMGTPVEEFGETKEEMVGLMG
jgi:hypothetical protein